MFKVNDEVMVKVLKYRFRGTIVEIDNDMAKVSVPTHYHKGEMIVESKVEDLNVVIRDMKHLEEVRKCK